MKIGKIELSDWELLGDYWYRRYGIQKSPIIKLQPIIGNEFPTGEWLVHFYSSLSCLHKLFPDKIEGDAYDVKKRVDQFLTRVNNLIIFT